MFVLALVIYCVGAKLITSASIRLFEKVVDRRARPL